MFRTLGFIVGSGLVAWVFIWVADMQLPGGAKDVNEFLSTPLPLPAAFGDIEGEPDPAEPVAGAAPAAPATTVYAEPAGASEGELDAPQLTDSAGAAPEESSGAVPLTTEFFFGDANPPAAEDPGVPAPETGPPVPEEMAAAQAETDWVADDGLQWHVFWQSFRSEISATGFVEQLERVTGLNYRVERVKSGVYQVAFSHLDDAEKESNLAKIEGATGLRLTGMR